MKEEDFVIFHEIFEILSAKEKSRNEKGGFVPGFVVIFHEKFDSI